MGVTSDYFVSTQLQLWLFCCWGCGCCWALTIKLFADDFKLFLGNVNEVDTASDIINQIEGISGLMMHRDPAIQKCQALPFGDHRDFQGWPAWVTVKDEDKIVGAIAVFSNKGNLEKINSNLVQKCFFDFQNKSYGIKGTIFQTVYFVNTYLFSKIWYIAQCFMIDKNIIKSNGFYFCGAKMKGQSGI